MAIIIVGLPRDWRIMEWKDLRAAALYDNDTFIKEYLERHEQDKDTLTKVLHKAVESCSIKVVQAILNSSHGMY